MIKQTRNIPVLVAAAIAAAACGGGNGASDSTPLIGTMADVTVPQDTTAAVPVPASSAGQASASSLTISATSSDGTLLPLDGISVQTVGGKPTLNVTPAEDATGVATINVVAADSQGRMARQSFKLTVNAVYVSFSAFSNGAFAKTEGDSPLTVRGYTFVQDADETTFDPLIQ